MIPVILSGGSGTRLWPLSRPLCPKQFLPVYSDKTLMQETVLRLSDISDNAPIVVCNEEHRFMVAENLRDLNLSAHSIILEPMARNTAPAIAAAAMMAMKDGDDPVLMVLPADHVIKDIKSFAQAAKIAEEQAANGKIVTFGITPTSPHTGYGYIETGKEISTQTFDLSAFKEKPDEDTAKSFLKSGNYFWNSGMFCFKASVFLDELKAYAPELLKHTRAAIDNSAHDLDFDRLAKDDFEKCDNISIDYAVMENTKNAVVVTLDADWSDIGSWDALWDVSEKDENGNVLRGDVMAQDSTDNLVFGDERLVSALGVENLMIVDTQDAVLVADRSKVQDIKKIVETLKTQNRKEAKHHRTVYRPWGHYDSIGMGERDQVKRISVKPGAKLSIQKHHHRSEHWIVVKGTAQVTRGDEVLLLTENESVYIPLGTVHALENPGKIMLEIIEVQTGSYLGEDDIVRLEDRYGRS